jgi:hypothetical protein
MNGKFNWDDFHQNPNAVSYAANDAIAALLIFHRMLNRPDPTIPLPPPPPQKIKIKDVQFPALSAKLANYNPIPSKSEPSSSPTVTSSSATSAPVTSYKSPVVATTSSTTSNTAAERVSMPVKLQAFGSSKPEENISYWIDKSSAIRNKILQLTEVEFPQKDISPPSVLEYTTALDRKLYNLFLRCISQNSRLKSLKMPNKKLYIVQLFNILLKCWEHIPQFPHNTTVNCKKWFFAHVIAVWISKGLLHPIQGPETRLEAYTLINLPLGKFDTHQATVTEGMEAVTIWSMKMVEKYEFEQTVKDRSEWYTRRACTKVDIWKSRQSVGGLHNHMGGTEDRVNDGDANADKNGHEQEGGIGQTAVEKVQTEVEMSERAKLVAKIVSDAKASAAVQVALVRQQWEQQKQQQPQQSEAQAVPPQPYEQQEPQQHHHPQQKEQEVQQPTLSDLPKTMPKIESEMKEHKPVDNDTLNKDMSENVDELLESSPSSSSSSSSIDATDDNIVSDEESEAVDLESETTDLEEAGDEQVEEEVEGAVDGEIQKLLDKVIPQVSLGANGSLSNSMMMDQLWAEAEADAVDVSLVDEELGEDVDAVNEQQEVEMTKDQNVTEELGDRKRQDGVSSILIAGESPAATTLASIAKVNADGELGTEAVEVKVESKLLDLEKASVKK